jgi:glycosyltransferase involved in cell wall biosynthesis
VRITIATGPLFPVPAVRGGAIARMWHGLAREFSAKGNEVCVVARACAGQAHDEVDGKLRFLRGGGFDQGSVIALDLAKDLAYAARAVWRLPQADILITNDFWLPLLAAGLRRRAGRIVVNANRYPKRQYFLYRGAARIAAASSAVRDAIAAQTPSLRDRIRVFPNPVDTAAMTPDPGKRRTGPRIVLFVGRLHPEKGVHVLAKAFAGIAARHPGWRLRLVGPWAVADGGGGESYLAALKSALRGVAADVAGPCFDARALIDEYRAASLFCYPSLAEQGESFGLAALEAMACGAPPLVSSLACFRDFVDDGVTGWTFAHRGADPAAALAAALERLLQDPAGLEAAGERAAQAARAFGYAEVAEHYLDDFRQLLAQGGGARA